MYYLVCYDIADERRLQKVAKTMLGFGERVQLSVFECELDERQYAQMLEDVQRIMAPDEDSLRSYVLCHRCRQARQAFGIARVTEPPDVFIV